MQSELNTNTFRNLLVLSVITLPFKAYCVWKASQNKQIGWFIALFAINTIGIMELVYLFYFSKPKIRAEKEK